MKSRRFFRWKRAALVALAGMLALGSIVWTVRLPAGLHAPVTATPSLVDTSGRLLAELPRGEARFCAPLPLNQMGRWLPAVTIALEDHRFASHSGCDFYAMAAALWR